MLSQSGRTSNILTGPAYARAKAGILGLTKQQAYKMSPYEMNIKAVVLGLIRGIPSLLNQQRIARICIF